MSTYVTSEMAAKTALAMLATDLVLGATVHRAAERDFGRGTGAVVHVRRPAVLAASDRDLNATTAITLASLDEGDQPVTLSKNAYSAVALSDADATLNITDFARQVLAPQVAAVSRYAENVIAGLMGGLVASTTITYDAANPLKALLAARKALRDMGVPAGAGLYAAVGTSIAADLLASDKLSDASVAGDSTGLHEATLGRLAGFTVIESNLIGEKDIVAYHGDAFSLATVAPAVPQGAAHGVSIAENGFALRHLMDYDSLTLQDRSIVSTLVGGRVNTLKDPEGVDAIPAIRITSV